MDFLRKQAKENFRCRQEAMDVKKRHARLLLGLTKPREQPKVIGVVKAKLVKPINPVRFISSVGIPRCPDGSWHTSAFTSGFGFETALSKKGWVKLGGGAFSSVWARNSESTRVLKVTRRPDNWINYIQWAAKNGYMGRFAPHVYSFKRVKGVRADFLLSVVERIDKTLYKVDGSADAYLVSDLFQTYGYHKNIMAGVFLDEMVPGLARFTEQLHAEFGKGRLDLHPGNVMLRTDGSFVVTDPVADDYRDAMTVTRLKAKDLTFAGYSIYLNEREFDVTVH